MATATGMAAAALLGLLTLLAAAWLATGRAPRPSAAPAGAAGPADAPRAADHPESLSTALANDCEEYLAWLADHLWPDDEYLDLEREWRDELGAGDLPAPYESPLCPHCRLRREDVWPCPHCGRLLHPTCGHGMRRRRVDRPYLTYGTGSEAVVGEWICTGCRSVVGLDVAGGDETGGEAGDMLA
ncbi:hypothetical protein Arub01_44100 [Actinomadura rubrobrunea]|uniref:Uncharacterized protein n=1 Tax=Actinomadura rubrobrunea TaxID=115335 RepID=A0A9W6UVZ8_9ACTN|nr:hypothetical protein [Actinomadura rubrobrunea]GLW66166.1 hypothetical protein Arub01_44100 [Actinomadura rubrobrunea]